MSKLLQNQVTEWDHFLPTAQIFINNSTHSIHELKPFYVIFARHLNGFSDYSNETLIEDSKENILSRLEVIDSVLRPITNKGTMKTLVYRKHDYTLRQKITEKLLPLNSRVLLKLPPRPRSLFGSKNEGPFFINSISKAKTYELRDSNGNIFRRKYPRSQFKLYLSDPEAIEENEPIYIVEKIIAHRGPSNSREYFVKWYKYDESSNFWEPYEKFLDTTPINDYWKFQKACLAAGEDVEISI